MDYISSPGYNNLLTSPIPILKGTFDGLGHTVEYDIYQPISIAGYDSNVDAYGFIGRNYGTIANLGVGGLISITDVLGTATGALAGANYGTIINCNSDAEVQVQGGFVGGLVGFNSGTIKRSFFDGSVTNANVSERAFSYSDLPNATGGLVGNNYEGTLIDVYSAATVANVATALEHGYYTHSNAIGGLVGLDELGSISRAYSTSNVQTISLDVNQGPFWFGGLIGADYFASMSDVFAAGTLNVSPAQNRPYFRVGGLVGGGLAEGFDNRNSIVNGYYDDQTTGQAAGLQSDGSVGLSTADIQGTLPTGFDPSNWVTASGLYPHLKAFGTLQTISGTVHKSDGSAADASAYLGLSNNGIGIPASIGAGGSYTVTFQGTPLPSHTALGAIVGDVSGGVITRFAGVTYSDSVTPSSGNVTGFDVTSDSFQIDTANTTYSGLQSDLENTFFGWTDFIQPSLNTRSESIIAANGFTLDTAINRTSDLSLTTTSGDISLTAPLTLTGHALTLNSAGAIFGDTSAITVATLTGSSAGGASFNNVSNAIGTLGSFSDSGDGNVTIADSQPLHTTGSITAGAGNIVINAATMLGADTTFTGGNVTFGSTLDGAHVLDITASGVVSFLADLGGTTPLSGLTVTGSEVDLPNSVATGAGGVSITATQGDLTIDQALSTTGNLALAAKGGNLTLATPISFGGSSGISFDAYGSVFINAPVTISGTGAAVITTNDGGTGGDYGFGLTSSGFTGALSFTGAPNSGQSLTINGNPYTLVYTASNLVGLNNGLGHYALANNLDLTGTTYSNTVIGTLRGTFTGLGHHLSNLSITTTTGLSGFVGVNRGTLRDLGLTQLSVTGGSSSTNVGGLVGYNLGTVTDASVSGTISGGNNVGGLAGYVASGSVTNSNIVTGSIVTGFGNNIGGITGYNRGTLSADSSSGDVNGATASHNVGGIAGFNQGTLSLDHYTGDLLAGSQSYNIGGLVGDSTGSVDRSDMSGTVKGGGNVGGLVGYVASGSVTNSDTLTGSIVTGSGNNIGGIAGFNKGTLSSDSSAADVNGDAASHNVGGVAGYNQGTLSLDHDTGNVQAGAQAFNTGGLAGYSTGSIDRSDVSGSVSGGSIVGGLVGYMGAGSVTNSATLAGAVVSGSGNYLGGIAGYNKGTLTSDRTSADVLGLAASSNFVGGLVGRNQGTVDDDHATGNVTGHKYAGAIFGYSTTPATATTGTGTVNGH